MSGQTPEQAVTKFGPDEVLKYKCPFCGHIKAFAIKAVASGISTVCEGCGAHLECAPQSFDLTGVVSFTYTCSNESKIVQVVERPDGIWVFLDDDEKALPSSLDFDSDRSVAIIVGSMIEARIKKSLLARFKRDKAVEGRMFSASGALGTFSGKIDLAKLFGLISDQAYKDLMIFKDIRNDFAHKLWIRNFSSDSVRDKSMNFTLIDEYVGQTEAGKSGGHVRLVDSGEHEQEIMFVQHAKERKKLPKERYLMTAQLISIRFGPCELLQYPLPLI
jgi:hypothetical protein